MEVNPSQLVLKPNSPGVDLSIKASLVSSVSRSIRSYGSLEIVVENDEEEIIYVNSAIEVQTHVKFVSSLTLTPKHVSFVARSGVAVKRSSQTYWRPRSPSLTKDDDREILSCLKLTRRRVRVTLGNDDPKNFVSYSSVASHLNLRNHSIICDDGEMWQRVRIRLEPAHGTIEPNEHKHVDLILEREDSDADEIEDDDMSTEDEDEDENDREDGNDSLKGLLVIRTQTLSLRLRVSIEIRRDSISPLSSPILELRKNESDAVVKQATKEKDVEVKLKRALERIQYLEALLGDIGGENTLQRRFRAVAEPSSDDGGDEHEDDWE